MKFFFILTIVVLFIPGENLLTRELSIKQIEERKKKDSERELRRSKKGKKIFLTEINLTTEVVFLTKEREVPPVLSNLDPILDDEGFYGIELAKEDNLTTGYFLGHDYKSKMIQVSLEENLVNTFKKLVIDGYKFFVVDLNKDELIKISSLEQAENVLIFNTSSKENILREEKCKGNVFHIPPSHSMLSDALTQFLLKKNWKKWFLVVGPDESDKLFSEALKKSAEKFNIKIKEERNWDFSSDLRRTAQKEVPIFTKGANYDVLIVSDEDGEFGEYLTFRTWDPRPIAGTQGLVPRSWHRTHEQWGAVQMQNRFRRTSGRWMTEVDYAAWVAFRVLGDAVTRTKTNDLEKIKSYILSKDFGIGAYKGVKVSFRDWNGQMRQPILLAAPRSMVSVSPQPGYLHPFSELDTLGVDKPETNCKMFQN